MSITTPEALTLETIKAWSPDEMKRNLRVPGMREAVVDVMRKVSLEKVLEAEEAAKKQQAEVQPEPVPVEVPPQPTPEEVAAAEAQRLAAEQEAARIAEEQEAARKAAETPKKFVIDYQVKDEDGNPIGRPTHLEAPTQEELIDKMKEAHIQATRAFHRLKKQKIEFKPPQQQAVVPQATDAELLAYMKDLKSDDPQKQLEAVRKVQKVETDRIQAEADKKIAEEKELRRQEQVTYRFLTRHKDDYNNNMANKQLLADFFQENPELAWTDDNLEIAFHALESKLAPVVTPIPQVVPVNPVPPAPVVSAPTTPAAPVAVVQPPAPAPIQQAVPVNPVPSTPRPGVNGGIVPGQTSATRPVTTTPKGLAVEDIKSWDGPTMRAKMRNPVLRAQIEALAATRRLGPRV